MYAGPLANALSFYQTERDGPNFIPNALRTAAAHLNDQNAMTYLTPHANSSGRFSGDLTPLGTRVDGSGGWWDAGDYIKGVETLGYTADLLLAGVRDFPAQMGAGSAASNFAAEAKFGTDWLLRMWDDPTRTLYYQVGIGTGNAKTVGDHDIWRLPQADDTYEGTDPLYRYIRNRPVFRAGAPGSLISPNLAGRDAAAFGWRTPTSRAPTMRPTPSTFMTSVGSPTTGTRSTPSWKPKWCARAGGAPAGRCTCVPYPWPWACASIAIHISWRLASGSATLALRGTHHRR